jgi:SPP1 family phage portal protein
LNENGLLTSDDPISNSTIIKDFIEADLKSERKREMKQGVDYFKAKHDILNRKITYMNGDLETEDPSKANHKLVHSFHRTMVLQKAGYIAGNPIAFSVNGDEADSKTFQSRVNELLGDPFNDKANMWIQGAANKGVEWLHPFIDKEGNFRYVIIPAEQIIPIYDTEYEEDLQSVIRYYSMTVVNGDKTQKRYRVELWDKEKVTYYMQQEDDSYALDVTANPNPCYHWYTFNTSKPDEKMPNSWGRIPFIALENNDDLINDLRFTKTLIDDYDLNVSDFSNNLSDIQELIWILRGYEGENLDEFLLNLKTKKAITVSAGEGTGASTEKAEIPKDARDSHLDRLEDNIFIFGMSVNMKTDKFGNSPSGIALEFMYELLNLNSNILIRKMKGSLREFMFFVTAYINKVDKKKYDYRKVHFTFNKSMITNTKEGIENAKNSIGIISDETIIENHPHVDDPKKEMSRLKKQRDAELIDYSNPNKGDDE